MRRGIEVTDRHNNKRVKRMRRWLRFSLWQMLAVTLVCAVGLAYILNPILTRPLILRRIEELGAHIETEQVPGSKLESLRYWIEREWFDSTPATIVVLRADRCPVTDDDMKWIGRLSQLRELDLSFTNVTDTGIARLGRLSKLRFLGLNGTKVTARHIGMFEKQPMLRDVRMWATAAPATHSQSMAERRRGLSVYCRAAPPAMFDIDFQDFFASGGSIHQGMSEDGSVGTSSSLADRNIELVSKSLALMPIGSLHIASRKFFKPEEAAALGQLRLEALHLRLFREHEPAFSGYRWLTEIQGLRSISLGDIEYSDAEHDAKLVQALSQVQTLRRLHIGRGLFAKIDVIPQLESLGVRGASDNDVRKITAHKNLTALQLLWSPLSDSAYASLATELQIENLNVLGCGFLSEQALRNICRMKSIRELTFDYDVTIEASGLDYISELKSLQRLDLRDARLSDENHGIQALSALSVALPDCEIDTSGASWSLRLRARLLTAPKRRTPRDWESSRRYNKSAY